MNFDHLSFVIGKHGDYGPVRDVVSYLIGRVAGTAGEIWQTLTNVAIASFTAFSTTLRELVIDVTPVQSGSGDPSPSNIRPISGWTGANIHNTQYGIFPVETEKVVEGYYVLAIKNTQIRKTYTGATANNFLITGAQVSEVFAGYQNIPAGRYSFKGAVSSSKGSVAVTARFATAGGENPKDIVLNGVAVEVPEGHLLLNITMSVDSWSADDWVQLDDFVLAVEPEGYSVSWQTEAGTVYGGTLTDNGNGTWTLVKDYVYSNLGNYATNSSGHQGGYQQLIFYSSSFKFDASKPILCNISPTGTPGPDISINYNSTGTRLYVSISDTYLTSLNYEASITGAKQFLTDNGAMFCYGVTTPQIYTITADSVQALLGQNNIFADTGNINTITFRTH